ncbi:MAG: chemotaxis protein CheB [Roseateles sp.]|uniref:chemotaxis protein CheB n=1 Tax=Roseateles sp. TaxID=1971397 RepID=UPI004036F817
MKDKPAAARTPESSAAQTPAPAATHRKVAQASDRTEVRPGCVYVIPPNRDRSIFHGVRHLFEPTSPRGLRLPVDFFLRSLPRAGAGAACG